MLQNHHEHEKPGLVWPKNKTFNDVSWCFSIIWFYFIVNRVRLQGIIVYNVCVFCVFSIDSSQFDCALSEKKI